MPFQRSVSNIRALNTDGVCKYDVLFDQFFHTFQTIWYRLSFTMDQKQEVIGNTSKRSLYLEFPPTFDLATKFCTVTKLCGESLQYPLTLGGSQFLRTPEHFHPIWPRVNEFGIISKLGEEQVFRGQPHVPNPRDCIPWGPIFPPP